MRPRSLTRELLPGTSRPRSGSRSSCPRCCAGRRRSSRSGAGSADAAATARRDRRSRCPRRRRRRATRSSLANTPAYMSPMPARMAPVRVARSTRCVAPSRRAHHSASARIRRPSASGLVTSTVRPAAVVMTSVGRIAVPLSMFSQAGHDARDRQREPELGDRAQRRHDRRAAGHVGLLADDVGLRLEEVAAGVERDGLADEREPRRVRRAGRLVPERQRAAAAAGLLPPTAASAPRPAPRGSIVSTRSRGIAAARSASPAGEITFGGASTSSRATFVQRATSAARSATAASSSPQPQMTKRSTPRGRSPVAQRRRRSRRGRRLRPARGPAPRLRAAGTRRAPTRPCRRRGTRAPLAPRPSAAPRRPG